MKAIPGGVDKVTHPNVSRRDDYTKGIKTRDVSRGFDLSRDAYNCIEGTSPFGKDKRHGVSGKRTHSRNQ